MLRHNFCSLGRPVKLFLFSTLLRKSPLTSIHFATFEKKREVSSPLPNFATFEKKREVRSPLPTQPNFLVFGNIYIYIY